MPISIFKRNSTNREMVDIEEVFNLWTLLGSRYENDLTIKLLKNFIHDRDLYSAIMSIKEGINKQIQVLETETEKFQIKVPQKPPKDVVTSMRMEEFSDRYIYSRILSDLKEDLFTLSRSFRTSTTNDRLRGIFKQSLSDKLNEFDLYLKYGKTKDLNDPSPTYKTAKTTRKEQLSTGEAFHLWDHLSQRYDQIELTQFFLGFVHDPEFHAILKSGLDILLKQSIQLEQILTKYEIPMSYRPPNSVKSPIDPETLEDVFMYRTIIREIAEAIDLHLRAVIQSTRNNFVRKIFREILIKEIETFDKFLKYGKAKGWINVPPPYTEPT